MSLTNRPIIPKQPKIKNTPLIKWYRANHKQCELCALDGDYAVADDIHHIIPNHGRSDRADNIVALCRRHHIDCTEHIHGDLANKRNILIMALKYLKGEITNQKLNELGILDQVLIGVEVIEPRFRKYQRGGL